MNEMQIFNNPEFGGIRVIAQNGETWFVASDVCRALELSDTSKALERLDDDEKGTSSIRTPGGAQQMSVVNEPGLYTLVLGSRKPEAKAFKRWITHEVLPAIRRTGGYLTPEAAAKLDEALQQLAQRVEALERCGTQYTASLAAPEGEVEETVPGKAFRARWMRTASEKLALLSCRFGRSTSAILHKLYVILEEEFGVDLNEEKVRIIEDYDLGDCSTLTAVFYDPEFRAYFQNTVDFNLSPENRGW